MEHFDSKELNLMGVSYYKMTASHSLTEEEEQALRSLSSAGWKNLDKEEKAEFWKGLLEYERTQIPKVKRKE